MEEFETGDRVALKDEFLKAKERDVSCVRIIKAGFPNEFVVSEVLSAKGMQALVLFPCCGNLRSKAGKVLCEAHPAALFRLIERGKPGKAAIDKILKGLLEKDPKRFVSVSVPLLGPLIHFAQYDKDDEEALLLQVAGMKPIVVAGRDLENVGLLLSKLLPGKK